jgi:hypothetical protein
MGDEAMLATRNNVEWCDTVCRTHAIPRRLDPDFWVQPRKGPPYYSNCITLSRSGETRQHAAIESLKADLPDGFSIKDSFASLDLSAAGFRTLFDAEWFWREPADDARAAEQPDWIRIESGSDLLRWEAAWSAAGSPSQSRVFLPALLEALGVAFFGVERGGDFVAGCIANFSRDNVVGFSNFFASAPDRDRLRAGAVAKVAGFAPGLPIVGYDRGEDLTAMLTLGFRPVGALRVWLWP